MEKHSYNTYADPAYPVNRQTIYLMVAKPKAIVLLKLAGDLDNEVQAYIEKELDVACQLRNLCVDDLGYVLSFNIYEASISS